MLDELTQDELVSLHQNQEEWLMDNQDENPLFYRMDLAETTLREERIQRCLDRYD